MATPPPPPKSRFLLFYFAYPPPLTVPPTDCLPDHETLLPGLLGRYRLAPTGVNAILQGPPSVLEAFQAAFVRLLQAPPYNIPAPSVDWKLGDLRLDLPLGSQSFPDLKVQKVKEIVSYLNPPASAPLPPPPDSVPVSRLSPSEWHLLLSSPSSSTVLLDVRNLYESNIGLFCAGSGAKTLRPPLRKFSDFDSGYWDSIGEQLEGKDVLM